MIIRPSKGPVYHRYFNRYRLSTLHARLIQSQYPTLSTKMLFDMPSELIVLLSFHNIPHTYSYSYYDSVSFLYIIFSEKSYQHS